jgi:hypothetical protein
MGVRVHDSPPRDEWAAYERARGDGAEPERISADAGVQIAGMRRPAPARGETRTGTEELNGMVTPFDIGVGTRGDSLR